jgi:hypothetical protein
MERSSRTLPGVKAATNVMLMIMLMSGTLLLAQSQAQASSYPAMAPVDQYRMPPEAEIKLARSAAPESISHDAEILTLGQHGFETAVKGKNGFVCTVQRSWAAGTSNPEFWNPKVRAPICFNAVAAKSFLPRALKKTEWALSGVSKDKIGEKIKAAFDTGELKAVETGAMCYMMSKDGYLSDDGGHWHSHLMFFVPATTPEAWGAGLDGSPLLGVENAEERVTVFLLPVAEWSDGTASPPM